MIPKMIENSSRKINEEMYVKTDIKAREIVG
jgi:hypothetical protein